MLLVYFRCHYLLLETSEGDQVAGDCTTRSANSKTAKACEIEKIETGSLLRFRPLTHRHVVRTLVVDKNVLSLYAKVSLMLQKVEVISSF